MPPADGSSTRGIYVCPRTGPQSAHLQWPAVANGPITIAIRATIRVRFELDSATTRYEMRTIRVRFEHATTSYEELCAFEQ